MGSRSDGFLETYRRVVPFVSEDSTRRVLQQVAVCIDSKGSHNVGLVATDGRRLCYCNSISLVTEVTGTVLLPVSKFLLWRGLGDEVEVGVERAGEVTRVGFRAGPWSYSVKSVDGTYPNWRQVVPDRGKLTHHIVLSEQGTKSALALLAAFRTVPGGIAFEGRARGGLLMGNNETKRSSWVRLEGGSSYTGAGCTVVVDGRFLQAALEAGFSNFAFADERSPLMSEDGRGGTHLLMPLMLSAKSHNDEDMEPSEPSEPSTGSVPEVVGSGDVAPTHPAQPTQPASPVVGVAVSPVVGVAVSPVTAADGADGREVSGSVRQVTGNMLPKLRAAYEDTKRRLDEAMSSLNELGAALGVVVEADRRDKSSLSAVRAAIARIAK